MPLGVAHGTRRTFSSSEKLKLGEVNTKEDLREKVTDIMMMMMAKNKMMRVTMLQRENTDTWASYWQHNAGLTTAAKLH